MGTPESCANVMKNAVGAPLELVTRTTRNARAERMTLQRPPGLPRANDARVSVLAPESVRTSEGCSVPGQGHARLAGGSEIRGPKKRRAAGGFLQ